MYSTSSQDKGRYSWVFIFQCFGYGVDAEETFTEYMKIVEMLMSLICNSFDYYFFWNHFTVHRKNFPAYICFI